MRYLILAIAVLLTVGAGIAVADPGDDGTVINACAMDNNGQLRIVDGPDDCNKSEYLVSWNIQGDPGLPLTTYWVESPIVDVPYAEVGEIAGRAVVTAECDPGDVLTGGGFNKNPNPDLQILISRPWQGPVQGWFVDAVNFSTSFSESLQAYVVCADLTP